MDRNTDVPNPNTTGPSDFLSPIITQGYASMDPTDGATAELNSVTLMNPNRTAMLLDAIRFRYVPETFSTGAVVQPLAAQFNVEIFYGATKITNGAVPLGSFCPTYTTYTQPRDNLLWTLPKPLYVPPDVPVRIRFTQKKFDANIETVRATMYASLVGRSMPLGWPKPTEVYVPWVAATSVYNDVDTFESADNELGNPFDSPMKLTRLVGFNGFQSGSLFVGCKSQNFSIQATFSNQRLLIRDPTPFYAVFPGERPFMRLNNVLQPKEFIRVYLDLNAPTGSTTQMNFTTVGMVGYRALSTPLGALP